MKWYPAMLAAALLSVSNTAVFAEAADPSDSYLEEQSSLYRYAWSLEYPEQGPYDILIGKNAEYGTIWMDQEPLPDCALTYQIEDFDSDGHAELLLVFPVRGEFFDQIQLQMYEVQNSSVTLAAELTSDCLAYPREEGIVHVFLSRFYSQAVNIVCDYYDYVSHTADGASLGTFVYRYNGTAFEEEGSFFFQGSDFSDCSLLEDCEKLGIPDADDYELFHGIKTAYDYISDTALLYLAEILPLQADDWTAYNDWMLETNTESYLFGYMNLLNHCWLPDGLTTKTWGVQVTPQRCLDVLSGASIQDPLSQTVLSDYLLPTSSSSLLSAADLAGLTTEELRLARNEIYARHGRIFQADDLNAYFSSKSWYHGTIPAESFHEDEQLSDIERQNLQRILDAEASRS